MICAILIILAITVTVVCFSACVVAGRADDAEERFWEEKGINEDE